MKRICIDPGHPSYYIGTKKINWGCECDGIKEVEINLSMARILADILTKNGFNIMITRDDNYKIITNKKRAYLAKVFKADLFLRIHADYERKNNNTVRGFMTIYPAQVAMNIYNQSRVIASIIHNEVLKRTDLPNRGIYDETVTYHKSKKTNMLVGTYWANKYKIPTVLLETVCLSNPDDRTWIKNTKNQYRLMQAIAIGIEKYFDGLG